MVVTAPPMMTKAAVTGSATTTTAADTTPALAVTTAVVDIPAAATEVGMADMEEVTVDTVKRLSIGPTRGSECAVEMVVPLPEAVRKYPLATRTGVDMFIAILSAHTIGRSLSTRQRDALSGAYRRTLDAAVRDGVTAVPPPVLAADVHPLTRRALVRRGLVDDEWRLTPLAVEVVRYAWPDARKVSTDGR